jgi:hypothetical protein
MEDHAPLTTADIAGKTREARFLVEHFDIPPTRAAGVVCETEVEAVDIARRVTAEVEAQDPLAGLPVPEKQRDPNHRETNSSDLEKPVLHRQADQN